jgi:hypothetical protein
METIDKYEDLGIIKSSTYDRNIIEEEFDY